MKMLNYFVPTGKTSVVIKSKTTEETIVASEPQYNKILKKKIRVLINNGSASASEIFA
ncbi:TPA: hypothetical protein DEP21_03245 [Patescibacteria group bacterium]|nr:hypothetical protein [Candidatus Gracilibacteria bacterium]